MDDETTPESPAAAPAGTEPQESQSASDETLFDVISGALQEDAPEEGAPSTPEQPEQPAEGASETTETPPEAETPGKEAVEGEAEADPEAPVSDEDLRKALKPRARRRFDELLGERAALQQEVERTKPVYDFIRKNDIQEQDLDIVLGLSAQLRHGDFAGFLRNVQPYVNLAQQMTGQLLPSDLQTQVQQGRISPELAQELARARSTNVLQEQRHREAQARAARESAQVQQSAIRDVIANYEAGLQRDDPDYGRKEQLVRTNVKALFAERGVPRTPEQALAVAREAYEQATRTLRELRPAPQPVAPDPSSTRQPPQSPRPAPESFMDVINQTLAGSAS